MRMSLAALLLIAAVTGCGHMNLAHRHGCDSCQAHGRHGGHHAGGGHHGAGGHGAGGHVGGGHYGPHGGAHGTPGFPHHHQTREYTGPQGPSTAQVGYPYYTTRGPRDFFVDNPPSIGP